MLIASGSLAPHCTYHNEAFLYQFHNVWGGIAITTKAYIH